MYIVVGFALITCAIAVLIVKERNRFRRLWQEVFSFRKELQGLRKELVSLRKALLLSQVRHKLRLPALLPSEDGEDIILYNFFGRKDSGFYIEIGAYNGVELSNTYFFESVGWNGILIEPDPGLFQKCLLSRPNSNVLNVAASDRPGTINFTLAKGAEWLSFNGDNESRENRIIAQGGSLERIQVPCLTLNEILQNSDQEIDFVSLDVEGYELNVLRGFDIDRFRPRVFVIEQGEFDDQSPVSLMLKKHGYIKKLHVGSNSFYLHIDDPGVFSWDG